MIDLENQEREIIEYNVKPAYFLASRRAYQA